MISSQEIIQRVLDNPPGLPDEHSRKLQILLNKIRELEHLLKNQQAELFGNTKIPPEYTPIQWQAALQHFNDRFDESVRRKLFFPDRLDDEKLELTEEDEHFIIPMGPEWELKCAQEELEKLLQSK